MKRGRKARSVAERAAHDRFRRLVLADPCLWSVTRAGHRCDGPKDPHHVIRQSWSKFHFMPLKKTDPEQFWGIVHDPRMGVALCRAAHDRVTAAVTPEDWIAMSELPARVLEAAAEHGLSWRLEHECRVWQMPDVDTGVFRLPSVSRVSESEKGE